MFFGNLSSEIFVLFSQTVVLRKRAWSKRLKAGIGSGILRQQITIKNTEVAIAYVSDSETHCNR